MSGLNQFWASWEGENFVCSGKLSPHLLQNRHRLCLILFTVSLSLSSPPVFSLITSSFPLPSSPSLCTLPHVTLSSLQSVKDREREKGSGRSLSSAGTDRSRQGKGMRRRSKERAIIRRIFASLQNNRGSWLCVSVWLHAHSLPASNYTALYSEISLSAAHVFRQLLLQSLKFSSSLSH